MIKASATLIFSFFSLLVFSQDTIYNINGTKTLGKVKEVSTRNVSYTIGNTKINTPLSEVAYISYSTGQRDEFNMHLLKRTVSDTPAPAIKEHPKKNIVAINVFEMAFINFSCSYERILNSGLIGLKIPLSVGMGGKPKEDQYNTNNYGSITYLYNKIIGSGLELNYYPVGQNRHTFYVGLSGVIGSFKYFQYVYDTVASFNNGYGPYYSYPLKEKRSNTGVHYAGMIHMGGYLGITENLLIGGKFGVGYKREETIYVDYTHPKLQLDINLAFRF